MYDYEGHEEKLNPEQELEDKACELAQRVVGVLRWSIVVAAIRERSERAQHQSAFVQQRCYNLIERYAVGELLVQLQKEDKEYWEYTC